jgi:hypothetical protein
MAARPPSTLGCGDGEHNRPIAKIDNILFEERRRAQAHARRPAHRSHPREMLLDEWAGQESNLRPWD